MFSAAVSLAQYEHQRLYKSGYTKVKVKGRIGGYMGLLRHCGFPADTADVILECIMINLPEEADIFLTGEQLVRNRLTDKNKRIRWHANNTEFRRQRSPRSEMIELSVDAPSAEHMFSSFEDAVGELSKKFNVTPLNEEDSAKVMQDIESKIEEEMQQRQQRKRQRANQLRKEAEKVERARIESITDKLTKKKAHTALQQRVNQRVRRYRGRNMTTEEVQERRQERLKLIKAQIEQISDDETRTKRHPLIFRETDI